MDWPDGRGGQPTSYPPSTTIDSHQTVAEPLFVRVLLALEHTTFRTMSARRLGGRFQEAGSNMMRPRFSHG